MGKITDYTAATRFDSGDIILKDGTNGTKKITVANAAAEFAGLVSSRNRRNIWRGANLGTSVTTEQKAAIKGGTFDNMFIGDFWNISGVNWRIADMDYWWNCGNQGSGLQTHHLVIVPDSCLVTGAAAQMNTTDTTATGYIGSKMRGTSGGLEEAKKKIDAAFSGMVLSHREIFPNAFKDGHSSAGAWVDSNGVELMNEIMVYGCPIFTPGNPGTTIPYLYTIDNSQLSLFRLNPQMIKTRQNYWLRDVVSASAFALVAYYGGAGYDGASNTNYGVRPAFPIGVTN